MDANNLRRPRFAALAAVLVLTACQPLISGLSALSGEHDELAARRLAYDAGYSGYARGDFESLDATLDEDFGKGVRTPSGIWRGGVVFAGVQAAIGAVHSQAEAQAAEAKARSWVVSRPGSHYASLALATVYKSTADNCEPCEGQDPGSASMPGRERWQNRRHALGMLVGDLAGQAHAPEWQNLYLELASDLGEDDAKMQQYYARAVQRFPAYFPARFAWVDYLANQPDGARRVEQAARATLSEAPFDDRDALYARMLWWAAEAHYGDRLFALLPVDWPTFARSFDALLEQYPDDWNRNNYARFACLAGHRDRAIELMTGHAPLGSVWHSAQELRSCTGIGVR